MNQPKSYDYFTQQGDSSNNLDSAENVKDKLNQSLAEYRKKRNKAILDNPEYMIKEQIKEEKQNIIMQNKTRATIAKALNLHEFTKLKLTNKDKEHPIHSLFRWFMLVFYKEDPAHYEYTEFKKLIFDKDDGRDLQRRIELVTVVHMTSWDAEKTHYLLSMRPQMMGALKTFEKLIPQVEKIFDIVEIVLKTYEASNKIKHLLEQLVKEEEKIKNCQKQVEEINHDIDEVKTSLKSLDLD